MTLHLHSHIPTTIKIATPNIAKAFLSHNITPFSSLSLPSKIMSYNYSEHSSTKSMNHHPNKFNYLKKITQILLSASVFSFLFSQSSLVPVLVHYSYDYLVSNFNFKFKIFTYTTERNCIFLLCNGILMLIIQSSGLISKIAPVKSGLEAARIDDHHGKKGDEIGRFQENEKKGVGKAEILEEKGRENGGDDMEKGGILAAEVEREEGYQSCGIERWEEEDEGIDADELNKKCEDFIKKVKQEIQGA